MFAVSLFAQAPKGILVTPAEIQTLPTTGPAWDYLKGKADASIGTPDLSDQDDEANVRTLAAALVWARTGVESYRTKARNAILAIPGTESGGRTLALGRELPAYVIAADLCGLPADRQAGFYKFVRDVMRKSLDGKTLISTHRVRPNNWGTICGFARLVCDRYLWDHPTYGVEAETDWNDAVKVFRGYLGDRAAYAGFTYGDLSWQCDRAAPVGINKPGCSISGHPMDGGLPEELRRSGGFHWPPGCENYVGTGLEGVYMQAWVLARFGHRDVWTWSQNAIARASVWWHDTADCRWTGNDIWMGFLNDYVYGTKLNYSPPAPLTRSVIGADWWGRVVSQPPPPDPDPEPFTATWKFTFVNAVWIAHVDGTVDGTGATPNAALRNWTEKNPNEP